MHKSDVIDLFVFEGAIKSIQEIEEQGRTKRKGKIPLSSARKCGVVLTKLALNGGLQQLGDPVRARLYVAAAHVTGRGSGELELRQLMSEIGGNLQTLGSVKAEARQRAKIFCESFLAQSQ